MDPKWPWREAATAHVRALACTCITCLAVTLWWRRRTRYVKAGPTVTSRNECDNGCNNPNCLRCHSSSRCHVNAFRANVTMLRRLAKLEPDMFRGMREEIWSAVDEMERRFDVRSNDARPELPFGFRTWKWMQAFREQRRNQNINSDTSIKSDGTHAPSSVTPLSPQEGQNPTVFFLPGIEAIPLHDAKMCPNNCPCMRLWKSAPIGRKSPPIKVTGDVEALQKEFPIIRGELVDFLSSNRQLSSDPFKPFDPKVYTHAQPAAGQTSNSARKGKQPEWSSVYLYRQGIRQSEICNKYFPQTALTLETKCPHLMAGKCGFGSVYFSKLERGTKVKEHCGPTNVRWRCHLPLVVPEKTEAEVCGGSHLRVGPPGVDERCVGWEEGVPLLFDDSFLHSAVHRGDSVVRESGSDSNANFDTGGARVVLIVDFWHPVLSDSDRTALGVLYPPGS